MELALTIIGILGNITAVMLFLSPAPTFWKIIKLRSTGAYSAIPYICTLGNCLVWVFYGLPFITQNNMLVITINGFGIAMEALYLLIFIPYAQSKIRVKVLSMVFLELIFYGVMVTIALTVVPMEKRTLYVGIIATILNVAMYAAPLSVMKTVIKTRSVKAMPFLLSLCTLINSCLWFIYGLIKKDPFIIVPNALGVFFGVLQLALYGIFRNCAQEIPNSDVEATTITQNAKTNTNNSNE